MRPPEILGLIEEAAGTRMYEERKDKAFKTMQKKEKRVAEILSLLNEEISPKLDKLRDEKRSFLAYQKQATELERLARVLAANEWKEAGERVKRRDAELVKRGEALEGLREVVQRRQGELESAESEKKAAIKRRDKVRRAKSDSTTVSLTPPPLVGTLQRRALSKTRSPSRRIGKEDCEPGHSSRTETSLDPR
jgi:structural maintenance of chromosome 2